MSIASKLLSMRIIKDTWWGDFFLGGLGDHQAGRWGVEGVEWSVVGDDCVDVRFWGYWGGVGCHCDGGGRVDRVGGQQEVD